jgi:RHH-type transcriptional regulator, rel operon repressor / antitoxin RelB
MKIGEVRKMLAIELPEDIESRLDQLARQTGRTKADYVREAVLEHLDDIEDYALALHRLKNPEGRKWTLEELEQGLDLED